MCSTHQPLQIEPTTCGAQCGRISACGCIRSVILCTILRSTGEYASNSSLACCWSLVVAADLQIYACQLVNLIFRKSVEENLPREHGENLTRFRGLLSGKHHKYPQPRKMLAHFQDKPVWRGNGEMLHRLFPKSSGAIGDMDRRLMWS